MWRSMVYSALVILLFGVAQAGACAHCVDAGRDSKTALAENWAIAQAVELGAGEDVLSSQYALSSQQERSFCCALDACGDEPCEQDCGSCCGEHCRCGKVPAKTFVGLSFLPQRFWLADLRQVSLPSKEHFLSFSSQPPSPPPRVVLFV